MACQQHVSIVTQGHGDMHNLTDPVTAVVAASKIRKVQFIFSILGAPPQLTIEFKPDLQPDLPVILDKLPPSRNYGHEQAWHDGNGHSHLQATRLSAMSTDATAGSL